MTGEKGDWSMRKLVVGVKCWSTGINVASTSVCICGAGFRQESSGASKLNLSYVATFSRALVTVTIGHAMGECHFLCAAMVIPV